MAALICPECGLENQPDALYCDDCGAQLTLPEKKEEKKEETRLLVESDIVNDRYMIEAVLSRSTTCATYRALDTRVDDEVIWIKEKVFDDETDEEIRKQVKLYELLKENEHDNLVQVLDVFLWEGRLYTVYENLTGQDLETLSHLKGDAIDEKHILHIAIQAMEGIKHLHSLGILHRDIHPSHLFLTSKGFVKLMGFGMICRIQEPPHDNRVDEGFSPPEMYGLMGGKLMESSDLFSMGASLYYLITNSKPKEFSREHSFRFRPIDDLDTRIDKKFENIILKAVQKDPDRRFKNADEMLRELMKVEGEDTIDEDSPEKVVDEEVHDREKVVLEIFARSHVGMVRSINQDSCFVGKSTVFEKSVPLEYTLLIVADGMGGEAEGDKASSLAVRVISKEVMDRFVPVITGADTVRLYNDNDLQEKASFILKKSIEKANRVVFDYSREDVSRRGMGSTLTAAIIEKDNMCICHAGDTRAYVFNDEEGLVQLTEDHSLVGRLVRMGQLTREEALKSPQRSAIYRALGTSPDLDIDTYQRTLKDGDTLLICSDGVWEYFTDAEMLETFRTERSPENIGNTLVRNCLDRGADDNATLITIYVGKRDQRVETFAKDEVPAKKVTKSEKKPVSDMEEPEEQPEESMDELMEAEEEDETSDVVETLDFEEESSEKIEAEAEIEVEAEVEAEAEVEKEIDDSSGEDEK